MRKKFTITIWKDFIQQHELTVYSAVRL